jgi:hypothetical protein
MVNWNDVNLATSYLLQVDDNSTFSTPTTVYNGVTSTFTITGQISGIWYYRVQAENIAGVSDWSNTQMVSVKPDTPSLAQITNPGMTDAYTITWSASAGADGYLLQQSEDITFTLPITRYMGSAQLYRVTGQDGGDWYYRVLSYNLAGNSSWSTEVQSTTVTTPALQTPILAPIENSDKDGEYTIQWTPVTSATGYILEESSDPYFSSPIQIFSDTLTQTMITEKIGGKWHYRVRATSPQGNSPWSNSRSTTVIGQIFLPVMYANYEYHQGVGFDSEFNGSADGWESHSGIWSVDSQYYSTIGLFGTSASTSYMEEFTDFDFQARVKRTGCESCANRLIVRGTPLPLDLSNHWAAEYIFNYANNGYFSVGKIVNGVTTVLQGATPSPAIVTGGDWNILRVVASGNSLSFYINNTLVWSGTDSELSSGRVGLGMYRDLLSLIDNFQVDWAKLTPIGSSILEQLPGQSFDQTLPDQVQVEGHLDVLIP